MPTPVFIGQLPTTKVFLPQPPSQVPPILIENAELEVLRLVDLEDLSQEEAGGRMGVSRGTIWRLLKEARRKVAQALTEGREIRLLSDSPGNQTSPQV